MRIYHDHPNFLPEQRKTLLCEVHRSCRAELLRNLARHPGFAADSLTRQTALQR